MESVSLSHPHTFSETQHFLLSSRCWKERTHVCYSFHISFAETYDVPSLSSSTIEDIRKMCTTGLASLAFFYCDFRDDQKNGMRGLVSSLLVQLCDQSDAYYGVVYDFYTAHGSGDQHATDNELAKLLKEMLALPGQSPVYLIIDALDECPTGNLPSPREKVLGLVKDLVRLQIPYLQIYVTSRPEADIESFLGPLASCSVSLHEESGQVSDIEEYIKSVVTTDPKMRTWTTADKELVIEVLTRKADGM
jgi:hypothetical protein